MQYLIFYYCSLKNSYAETFAKRLIERALDEHIPLIERQSTAAYLSSFLSRAKYLRSATVQSHFHWLVRWLHLYIDQFEAGCGATKMVTLSEVGRWAVFYTIANCVFYIFCYREKTFHRSYQSDDAARKWDFKRIVECGLNPLRVCTSHTPHCMTSAEIVCLRMC